MSHTVSIWRNWVGLYKCEYRATHKDNLACHIQSVYEGAKYECKQCDYGTTCKDTLTRYIKSTHYWVKCD